MNARYQVNRKVRAVALIAALVTATTLFQVVSTLGERPEGALSFVAQTASAPVVR